MRQRIGVFVVAAVTLLALLASGVALAARDAPSVDDRMREIAAGLRCPVCQNLSVADSPSQLAQQMRALIRERLVAGKSREQIEAYFVSKYGEWVLLSPRRRGLNLLLWVGPLAGAALGLLLAARYLRRWVRRPVPAAGRAPEPALLERVRAEGAREPAPGRPIDELVPAEQNRVFDMYRVIDRLADEGSFFEVKRLFAPELITGLARLHGRVIGIVANQPKVKGGVLFGDSSDKGARFVWLCNAFNIPLLFLADVPGFMIGSQVERQGIIRHGAKLLFAVAEATVPKISVIVRKAYGAGYMAMSGASFLPDACIALPTAKLAIMAPEPAVNAIHLNTIQSLEGEARQAFIRDKRREYEEKIDLYRLASEFFIDAVVPGGTLRAELCRRFQAYAAKPRRPVQRWNGVIPG